MATLTQASRELFSRNADERFDSVEGLLQAAREQKRRGTERWALPGELKPAADGGRLGFSLGGEFVGLNDWSFGCACKMAKVAKETVNRLQPDTAAQVLRETLPAGRKPAQLLVENGVARSIHSSAYTRLWNADLVEAVTEAAVGFRPPPKGFNGATGLYAGEQDMFLFLIDPEGWIEAEGEAFAPGLFVANSEVGHRSLSVTTFWFQEVCQNHIVWGAKDVLEYSIRHTLRIEASLGEVKAAIEQIARKRDQLKDTFTEVLRKAATTVLGEEADDVLKAVGRTIPKHLVEEACDLCHREGRRFSVWALVEALTRLNREVIYAGQRSDLDRMAASLFALAA